MPKEYRLIPEDVPHIVRATVYEEILKEFGSSKVKSVRVDIPKKKPSTVYMGLLKAKKNSEDFTSIVVSKREEKIYLLKK